MMVERLPYTIFRNRGFFSGINIQQELDGVPEKGIRVTSRQSIPLKNLVGGA